MTTITTTTPAMTKSNEAIAKQVLRKAYGRRLVPDPEGGYTASIHEFPGCFAEGETADEALADLDAAAVAWVAAALDSGHQVPEPVDATDHSGKIALRVPRSLHRMAHERALVEGVSVNQLLVTAVATFLGQQDGIARTMRVVRDEAHTYFTSFVVDPSSRSTGMVYTTGTTLSMLGSPIGSNVPSLLDSQHTRWSQGSYVAPELGMGVIRG